MLTFGEFFKARRIALFITLRKFCIDNGLDAGNMSKLERGLLPPPQSRKKLEEYAGLLKIKKGSANWYTFFDLAAAETGRIPEDIMEQEAVVGRLLSVFRSLRGG